MVAAAGSFESGGLRVVAYLASACGGQGLRGLWRGLCERRHCVVVASRFNSAHAYRRFRCRRLPDGNGHHYGGRALWLTIPGTVELAGLT